MSNSVGDKSLLGTNKCVYERSENEQAMTSQNVFNFNNATSYVSQVFAKFVMFICECYPTRDL